VIPVSPNTPWSETPESNRVCPAPKAGGFPSPSPPVEKAGIEPARQRLQGAPGALPVIPRAAASGDNPVKRTGRGGIAAGQDACLYGAHAMEVSIVGPAMRHAGTAGIEPAHAALETAVLPLNYVPGGK
jgi:hypothetical protein